MKKEIYRKYIISDIDQILSIYNFHIENSFGNFEENTYLLDDFKKYLKIILDNQLPFIVCEVDESIVGFSFLTPFRNRSGYRFTFENSIYVKKDFMSKGIGYKLLKLLINESKKNKSIKNIIAIIGDKENKSSIKIHEKNGFILIGTIKNAGYKCGKWLDSIYMQKIINE